MILERADKAIAASRGVGPGAETVGRPRSMEEQALRIADLCGSGKAYRDKLADAYEGRP